jgi:sugar phosphate isomerase/epimerase
MVDCKPVGSPMAVDALSNCVETSTSRLPPGLVPYQSLIGRLLYASIGTRPDITMVVIRFMSDPSHSHSEQAKRVLRYLKRQQTVALSTAEAECMVFVCGHLGGDAFEATAP